MTRRATRPSAAIEEDALHDAENGTLVTTWLRRLIVIVCGAAAIASGTLAADFGIQRAWVAGGISLGLIGLVLPAEGIPGVAWLADFAFAGYALLGALSVWNGDPPEWVIVALGAAVIGWDVHHFRQRLAGIESVETPARLAMNHLRRLVLTVLSGIALGLAALYVRISFGVTAVIILGLIAVFGISRAVAYLRSYSD